MAVRAHLVFIDTARGFAVFRLRGNTTVPNSLELENLACGADVPVDARIYSTGYNGGDAAQFEEGHTSTTTTFHR